MGKAIVVFCFILSSCLLIFLLLDNGNFQPKSFQGEVKEKSLVEVLELGRSYKPWSAFERRFMSQVKDAQCPDADPLHQKPGTIPKKPLPLGFKLIIVGGIVYILCCLCCNGRK